MIEVTTLIPIRAFISIFTAIADRKWTQFVERKDSMSETTTEGNKL